ncbi:hypothetical protein GCM10009114_03200 [Aliiglaciecola litoralis]|uniref:Uncharacterized protein n=1 Tax=Aliiglaciecola litoralis TaxID=582857 RepID=A0ABN1LCL9_9ALTE
MILHAVESPAGPAPTTTTSNSIDSRSTGFSPYSDLLIKEINVTTTITDTYHKAIYTFIVYIDGSNFFNPIITTNKLLKIVYKTIL